MTIEEIKQAVSELPPKELALFRKWLENFDVTNDKLGKSNFKRVSDIQLRGKYKGKGLMKAFMAGKKLEKT